MRAATALVASSLLVGCATGDRAPDLDRALLSADDLPGSWSKFVADGSPPESDVCGMSVPDRDEPDWAHAAFAISADDGPIVGERIEWYADRSDLEEVAERSRQRTLPCEFVADGSRWRTERSAPPPVGDDGSVVVITDRDRNDSFNYQVVLPAEEVLILLAINQRTADRELVDELAVIAWDKAQASGLID